MSVKTMSARRDAEFAALIPPLTDDELIAFETNRLGFFGRRSDEDEQRLHIIPTPIGTSWWIWSHLSLKTGIETFTRRPTAISRMPLNQWRGFAFEPLIEDPIWEYPYPASIQPRTQEKTTIYFIQSIIGGPVKIGRAKFPEDRLKQHQTGSPFVLRIVRTIENIPVSTEKTLHRQWARFRLHGEWFDEKVLEMP